VITRAGRGWALFGDGDAARAFAAPNDEAAIVADQAREVLARFADHVGHDEPVFETS
jgi:hypothetical protein